MSARTLGIITGLSFNLFFGAALLAQGPANIAWDSAQRKVAANEKLYVVTTAHPKHRNACLVRFIDQDQIACTHSGHVTTYRAADVAALIEAGTNGHALFYFVGLLSAAVAATWGTVVLAPVCPFCAVATGVAALFLYLMTPLSGMIADGDSPDKLIYLAAGQKLQVKLH